MDGLHRRPGYSGEGKPRQLKVMESCRLARRTASVLTTAAASVISQRAATDYKFFLEALIGFILT